MAKADPLHFENLTSNVGEVLRLVEIHTKLTGTSRGRRHNVRETAGGPLTVVSILSDSIGAGIGSGAVATAAITVAA